MTEIRKAEFSRQHSAILAGIAANTTARTTLFGEHPNSQINPFACGDFLAKDRVLDGEVLFNWAKLARLHTIRWFGELNDDQQFAFEVFCRVYLALLPLAECREKAAQEAEREHAVSAAAAKSKPLLRRAIERLRARRGGATLAPSAPAPAPDPKTGRVRIGGGRFAPKKR